MWSQDITTIVGNRSGEQSGINLDSTRPYSKREYDDVKIDINKAPDFYYDDVSNLQFEECQSEDDVDNDEDEEEEEESESGEEENETGKIITKKLKKKKVHHYLPPENSSSSHITYDMKVQRFYSNSSSSVFPKKNGKTLGLKMYSKRSISLTSNPGY